MKVVFLVPGKPQGKARARTFVNATGKSQSMTPENTLLYENLIKARYINAAKGARFSEGTPVVLKIKAQFLPAKSASKKRKADMLAGRELPLKKPDIDNIVKVVADALNGVAYRDDTQIIRVVAEKEYAATEGLLVTVEDSEASEE